MTPTETPQPAPPVAPAPPAAPEARHGPVRRLLLAFTSPGEAFADIARRPGFVLPLLLLTLASIASYAVVAPRIDVESAIRAQLEKQGQMSEEQIDKAVETAMGFQSSTAGKIVNYSLVALGTPFVLFVTALAFFLGLKLLGGEARFAAILGGVAHAFWPPGLVGGAVGTVVALRHTRIDPQHADTLVRSNLAAFLPESTGPVLHALAASVDVLTIWTVVLLVLATAIIGRVRRGRAAALVLVLWGLVIAGKVGMALLRSAF